MASHYRSVRAGRLKGKLRAAVVAMGGDNRPRDGSGPCSICDDRSAQRRLVGRVSSRAAQLCRPKRPHSFSTSCDLASTGHPGWCGIYLELNSNLSEAGSSVAFAVDGETVTMPLGRSKSVSRRTCPECVGKMRTL